MSTDRKVIADICDNLLRLKGKVELSVDWRELREDRETSVPPARPGINARATKLRRVNPALKPS